MRLVTLLKENKENQIDKENGRLYNTGHSVSFIWLFGFFFPLNLSGCISKKYVREHIKSPLPMLFRDLVYTSSVVTKKPETTAGASRELQ